MKKHTNFIPFAKPSLGRAEEKAVISVLRSGWLTTGAITEQFEKDFAKFVDSKFALAVNSATAGLHLSLEALVVKPHTHVITTPYTFAASAEVIRYTGADPLFVDIEEDSYNIDPLLVEKVLSNNQHKVVAIIAVHFAGLPCNIPALGKLAKYYDIPLIEDTAHAFPVKLNGKYLGTFGNTGVFSFYANKTITTGEGGMIVTDFPDIAKRIKIMRLHGIDREVWNRYTEKKPSWYYQIVAAGYKYNISDIASAIGLVQLGKAKNFLERRRKIVKNYLSALAECDFLILPRYVDFHAWHLFIIKIKKEMLTINRDQFIEKLLDKGIGASVHYIPLHIMQYYKKRYGFKPQDYPISLKNYQNSLSLPLYPDLSLRDVERVIETIKKIGYSYRK